MLLDISFPFQINDYSYKEKGKIPIYLQAISKIEEFNSAYGENGEMDYYFNFINLFFNNLENIVYDHISFRDYPSKDNCLSFLNQNMWLSKIQYFDDFIFRKRNNAS